MSVLSGFTKVIPPPRFLTMPSVGVDISDTSLKYVQLAQTSRSEERYELKKIEDIDIPSGTVKRGEVIEKKQLAAVLKEVSVAIGTPYVRVSLPEERAYLFETEIKRGIPFKEIRGLLEFRLEENVPIPARDAFFDFEVIDVNEKMLRVAVAAYARDTIMNYFEACTAADLVPLSFEVEAQAIARAALPTSDRGAHLIVDFGKTRTGIGITYAGTLMYTSTIDYGGNELSNVLRRALGDAEESEFTKIKNTQGLIKGNETTEVHDALISTISVIKDELAARIQYWHTRDYDRAERRIQSVILCGGSSNLKGLPEYLSETLGIKTVRANVWQNVLDLDTTIPPLGRRFSYGYATAIGLALKNTV